MLWHRLREPLPAGVSHVIRLLFGLAPQCPGGTLTDTSVRMQVDAHRLLRDRNAGLPPQVAGEQLGGPVGADHADRMGIQFNHTQQFNFPCCCDGAPTTWRGSSRNGVQAAC